MSHHLTFHMNDSKLRELTQPRNNFLTFLLSTAYSSGLPFRSSIWAQNERIKSKGCPKNCLSVPIFLPSSERDLLFRAAKARARISVNAPKESQEVQHARALQCTIGEGWKLFADILNQPGSPHSWIS